MDPLPPPRRISLRLQGYDYSQSGAYFVTICTQGRRPLFGSVGDARVRLAPPGEMVTAAWTQLPDRFASVTLDRFVVMPDHLHGILILDDAYVSRPSVSTIVGAFKSLTTHRYGRGVHSSGWTPYSHRLWQRGYYEHIVRNELSLRRIREYIETNLIRWSARTGR